MASIVKILRVVADPNRLRILLLLEREELSVAELQEILAMGQSTISTHLSQLKQAGLVEDRRTGKNNLYRLKRENGAGVLGELLNQASEELPESKPDQAAVRRVLRKRQDKMRAFFDDVAGRFGRSYVPGKSWKSVAEALLKLMPPMVIADLGAGEGAFSLLLAQRAKQVIAVDTSARMVEVGTTAGETAGREERRLTGSGIWKRFRSTTPPSTSSSSPSRCTTLFIRSALSPRPGEFSNQADESQYSTSRSIALKKLASSTPTSGSASAKSNWSQRWKRPAFTELKYRWCTRKPKHRIFKRCSLSRTRCSATRRLSSKFVNGSPFTIVSSACEATLHDFA